MPKNVPPPNECAQILKAIADETRLKIVLSLFQGGKCGSEIAQELKLSQPHVAHHLGILRSARLVQTSRQGQKVLYKLHPNLQQNAEAADPQTLDMGCCRISFDTES